MLNQSVAKSKQRQGMLIGSNAAEAKKKEKRKSRAAKSVRRMKAKRAHGGWTGTRRKTMPTSVEVDVT
jgi:hypothetical protein